MLMIEFVRVKVRGKRHGQRLWTALWHWETLINNDVFIQAP